MDNRGRYWPLALAASTAKRVPHSFPKDSVVQVAAIFAWRTVIAGGGKVQDSQVEALEFAWLQSDRGEGDLS